MSDADMQNTDFAQPVASTAVRVKPGVIHEIAQLWSSVCFSVEHEAPKLLVVTSAMRGEGVTQIATALAVAGADSHSDLEIALVDFNVRAPQVAQIMGLRSSPGLCEVLRQRATLADALVPVNIGNLSVLPAGEAGASSTDLLRADRLRGLTRSLADRFHHVIIDAPPANLYPEAQVLGGLADGVLLVMRTGVTRRESVAEARRRIEQANGKVVGLVMNQRTFPIPGFIYRRM